MAKAAQRRAKTGGELGANGEWYEGGKWIANTERAKRPGSTKATGRQEIAPRQWEMAPEDGLRSIFAAFNGTWELNSSGQMACRKLPVSYWGQEYLDRSQSMADRFNSGERWFNG